jgi:hypothetical protein
VSRPFIIAGLAFGLALLELPSVARAEAWAESEERGPERTGSLTETEREILDRGEYSGADIAVSGLLGTVVGFGTGHAHQGRFDERGWIFLAGEGAALAGTTVGVLACAASSGNDFESAFDAALCSAAVGITGLSVLAAFKLWEIIDVWSHPPLYNRRYREIEARHTHKVSWSFHVGPNGDGGVNAGLGFRF